MGSAGSSRVESSIPVRKQVWNGSCHTTALCWKELDLGLVKCFSLGLRDFSGNEPQSLQMLLVQTCYNALAISAPYWGGFGVSRMIWESSSNVGQGYMEGSKSRAHSVFSMIEGDFCSIRQFSPHCWLELGKTSVEGIWHLQPTQFNCRQNSGVFVENAVSMKIPN